MPPFAERADHANTGVVVPQDEILQDGLHPYCKCVKFDAESPEGDSVARYALPLPS